MSSVGSIQGGPSHVYARQVAAASTRQAEDQAASAAEKASSLKASQPHRVDVRA